MRKSAFPPMPGRRPEGFSLIELMIAMFLGALVVAGLINVLMANRQAYRLQEAANFNQQNMRFAQDRIGWSLRMASFWGGVDSTSITGAPAVTATGNCNGAWVLNVNQPVYGYDGSTGMPTDLTGCVDNANYVNGSDILILRYANMDAMPVTGASAALSDGGIYLISRAGTSGLLFAGDGSANRPQVLPFYDSGNLQQGTYTYPYQVEMYYLRPCSDPGAGGICNAGSDGGNPIPTLMRLRLDGSGALVSEPVVEGVEQLQFEYGLRDPADPNHSTTPVRYEDATDMAVGDWPNVVSVRVGYVLRSQTRDTRLPHFFDTHDGTDPAGNVEDYKLRLSGDCRYQVSAAGVIDVSACPNFLATGVGTAGQAQQFLRTEMTSVVQVRNNVR